MRRIVGLVVLVGMLVVLEGCVALAPWVGWTPPSGMTPEQAKWEAWDCRNRAETAHPKDSLARVLSQRTCMEAKGFTEQ